MFQPLTGKQYLMIDVANNFGLDKDDWDDRIAWFEKNEDNLEALTSIAEEPALYAAGVRAWRNVQKGGINHYPISLDATSSGIQLLSCLTGDRKGAELCNVVDIGSRADAYVIQYKRMLEKTGGDARIDRKQTKDAIMTAFYGSEATPKRVFGEGQLLDIFTETMEEGAPYAWELNQACLAIWNPDAISYDWVMPNNFHVHIKVMANVSETVHFLDKPYEVNYTVQMPIEKGRSLCANMTHSVDGMVVAEMKSRCGYDKEHVDMLRSLCNHNSGKRIGFGSEKDTMVAIIWNHYKDSGFLSVRILDFLDANNIDLVERSIIAQLIDTLPKKPFDIISVHDCFRCLPNYGNDLRRQYNQVLSDIARSDMLSFLMSQIMKRPVKLEKADPELWKDILEANYALS